MDIIIVMLIAFPVVLFCILTTYFYTFKKQEGLALSLREEIHSQSEGIRENHKVIAKLKADCDKLEVAISSTSYLTVPEEKLLEASSSRDGKTSALLEDTRQLINQYNLDVPQLIHFYGNLGYLIGASMAGYKEKGPSLEELKRQYYLNPTVDIAMMLQGLTITTWEEDYLTNPKLSRSKGEN